MKISGKIIDLFERRIYPGEITIAGDRIERIIPMAQVPDVWIMPGLVDAHVHIESSMVTPSHFAVAAVRHGTVAVVSDPHEIANVLGVEGVRYMIENGRTVPLKFIFGAPSCVPATAFESSGAAIEVSDIEDLIARGEVSYLAEMMNFPGVIYDDKQVHDKLRVAKDAGMPIDGHAPGLTGAELKKYTEAGISTDHECSTLSEALEKISLGMKILIREGSAARNLKALAPLIKTHPEMVMLCSDDLHPETLHKGHINRLVAQLISEGYDIIDVIRAATLNAANHYGIKTGMLREGDSADFIVVDSPDKMTVEQTWIAGRMVFNGKESLFSPGETRRPNNFNCRRVLPAEIKVPNRGGEIRVIKAQNGQLITLAGKADAGEGQYVVSRPGADILKLVVKERYNDAPPAIGFISGFGLKTGAMATSVAHDSHNIIAVGTDDRSIADAINLIIDARGGMSVIAGEETALLKLPIGGIMSDMPVSAVAARYERLNETVKSLGCKMDAPFMTLSFMALLVIPELKLSDKGLFDGKAFRHVPLFLE